MQPLSLRALGAQLLALPLSALLATGATAGPHGTLIPPPGLPPAAAPTGPPPGSVTPRSGPLPPSVTSPTSGVGAAGLSGSGGTPSTGDGFEGADLSAWTWWWELHKEPYLEVKAHLHRGPVRTGSDGYFLGRGSRRTSADSVRPDASQVRDRILPALLAALDEEATDVVTAALIAVARIGEDQAGPTTPALEQAIRAHLDDPNQEVAETAALALGILGKESSALILSELLLDTAGGRRLSGGEVSARSRAFAAYGLGLLGHQTANQDVRRYVVHKLLRALSTGQGATADVPTACVIALGRVPLPYARAIPEEGSAPATTSRETQILHLLELFEDPDLHRIARAHLPTALGALLAAPHAPGDEAVRESLKERVATTLIDELHARRRASREMRQSCLLGLGWIGDNDGDRLDRRIREVLLDAESLGGDTPSRHLALIAVARVAARAGQGEPVGLEPVRRQLLKGLARGRSHSARWSALALAVLERDLALSGHLWSPDVPRSLRAALADARSGLDIGAFAIACGIVRDQEAVDPLLDALRRTGEEQSRGHIAIALGMIEAPRAREPVRALVKGATYRPVLLRESAIALGLLGDREAAVLLADRLTKARSLAAQASIAQALGRIGDARSVDPLLAMLGDRKLTDRARAFAAVALGIVADKDDLPWNSVLSEGTNYNAAPPTLLDQRGFGVLNLL